MVQEQSLELLGAVEQALARNQIFGDSTYILTQLGETLRQRLGTIGSELPAAADLLDALAGVDGTTPHPVYADTVVRCAILHAQAQVDSGSPYGLPLADCEAVFAATAARLRRGDSGTMLADGSLSRLGQAPFHGWLWSEEHPGDVFGRSFRFLLEHRYEALPCTFSEESAQTLRQGARLVEDLLPALAPSALRHAQVIACVPSAGGWAGVASSSQFHLGGTVFLGQSLQSPWWVAEHLFHEALHQKLYDFRHGHLLLNLDYTKDGPTTVCSPWNPPRFNKANYWDIHRVFAAFHVYVHVALLALVAEQRAEELVDTYGPFQGMIESGKALERAHYLGEQLKRQCWDQLGVAGRNMVDWLLSALAYLNPAPPPPGAVVHLCMDLYEKEAGKAATALSQAGPGRQALAQRLAPLAREEAESARGLLAAIGARAELGRLSDTVARYRGGEIGARFPEVRRAISAALTASAPSRYLLTEPGDHDELLLRMTQDASVRLYGVLAGYPAAVAAAKLRESESAFPMPCNDQVGRLLAALAAAVPPGGRILEIGTGVGTGTAWLTSGLGERSDIELVSVEIDAGLSDAARKWQWPAYVEIVTADARDVLAGLGTFSLVFADAAPVKYGHLPAVLASLRPGGVLVMDDLEAGPRSSPDQRQEKEALRRSLLHQPGLHAADIPGLGAVLATRAGVRGDA